MDDSYFQTVQRIVSMMGGDPVVLDFATAQEEKRASRFEDSRLIAAGLASREEIQERNSFVPLATPVAVFDFSPSFRR